MTVASDTFEAIRDAVETTAPIEFDGLRLSHDADGYRLETPETERHGLDEDDLLDALESIEEYVTNWYYWEQTVDGEGTARRAFLRWCERAPIETDVADHDDHDHHGNDTHDHDTDDHHDHGDHDDHGHDTDDTTHHDDHGHDNHSHDHHDPLAVPDRYGAISDGLDREWGQLCVTTRLLDVDEPAGERVYDLWHVDDADADLADLTVYDDPRDAREIAIEDADGRYRPLKTAPTLVSGWAFTGLSGAELVETVDYFYPATIANWHRERQGALDIDHWLETAERQTGIYDVIDELPREAVDWMAEACCVDSQCLRRREWQYEEGDHLDVDGGEGEFPCREPCSLVVAAARKWTVLESEDDRTYQLELTTSDLNQLTALIDAVADGRTDEIREADVYKGANRYRARYLRAKRFTDEGELDVTQIEE